MTKTPKATVFGAGVWGSVLAQLLAKKGCPVTLWEHFPHLLHEIEKHDRHHPHIPHFRLEDSIKLTASLEEAAQGVELGVIVISSKAMRPFAVSLGKHFSGAAVPLVCASKGLEENSGLTMCEVIESELPTFKNMVMALSGPSFAIEIARAVPSMLVLAGQDAQLTEQVRSVLDGFPLRVESSADRRGVEWGGATKNVLAIACGIVDGLNLGMNTKAALITQAVREMRDIIAAAGGKPETVYGLAALGDFILTGTSELSRNHKLGMKLAQGKAVSQARSEINTVTEGADSADCVFKIVSAKNINAPVVAAVRKIIREGAPPETAVKALGF
ncbi:MAG: NAD(P)-dependent glycerol-3-phosphate dehydrogenase [Elusimicrobiales bacterium]|nr:NAD(P)-dependent glycerol-3-phosphate dehydrogenase [Elusimicrobiales bacterium]